MYLILICQYFLAKINTDWYIIFLSKKEVQPHSEYSRLPIQGWFWDWKRYTPYEKARANWLAGQKVNQFLPTFTRKSITPPNAMEIFQENEGHYGQAGWNTLDSLVILKIYLIKLKPMALHSILNVYAFMCNQLLY